MRLLLSVAILASASGFANRALLQRNPAFHIPTKNHIRSKETLLYQVSRHATNETATTVNGSLPKEKEDAFPGATLVDGKITAIPCPEEVDEFPGFNVMRPPPNDMITSWEGIKGQLITHFKYNLEELEKYEDDIEKKDALLEIYKSMQLSRLFEMACHKQYLVSGKKWLQVINLHCYLDLWIIIYCSDTRFNQLLDG